jgi:DNA-binding beta-propeller fold protein YncE
MAVRLPHRLLLFIATAASLVMPSAARSQTFKVDKYNIGGDGGMDYVIADAANTRVYIPRGTHVMVLDGATGKVVGDIKDTPRVHGVAFSKAGFGFTTNAGDSTVTMFNAKTMDVVKKIPTHMGGLDGIMYDDFNDRVILTNHSRPKGTLTAIDGTTGDVVGSIELSDNAPEGAASDGKGRLFVNLEGTNSIEVIDSKAMKVVATWPIEACDGPTGIAYDRASKRIFSGCSNTSVVVNSETGKVVAEIRNGNGVDALQFDAAQKLIYIPGGQSGDVTIVHEDSPDKYTTVATVSTMRGARTLGLDPKTHTAYTFAPEYGPAPAGATPPANGRGAARGPMVAAWMIAVHQ